MTPRSPTLQAYKWEPASAVTGNHRGLPQVQSSRLLGSSCEFSASANESSRVPAVSLSSGTIFVECVAFRVAKEVLVTSANLLHLMEDELGVGLNSIDSLAPSSKYLSDFISSDGITSMRAYLDKENTNDKEKGT